VCSSLAGVIKIHETSAVGGILAGGVMGPSKQKREGLECEMTGRSQRAAVNYDKCLKTGCYRYSRCLLIAPTGDGSWDSGSNRFCISGDELDGLMPKSKWEHWVKLPGTAISICNHRFSTCTNSFHEQSARIMLWYHKRREQQPTALQSRV
jgi:hypothetical protein